MKEQFTVLDLFSGAGGMSYGFHASPKFRVIGAADAQNGKPSSGKGRLECNKTYKANIGIEPLEADLSEVSPYEIENYLIDTSGVANVDVLISCAPCTGFSRTVRKNLVEDDARNSLVSRSADFVAHFRPKIFVMENVGELLRGKFSHHFESLTKKLEKLGYSVSAEVHTLSDFGLPQTRIRSLVIACRNEFTLRTMSNLWAGRAIAKDAITVRRAIAHLPRLAAGAIDPSDPCHISPNFSEKGLERLSMIPPDGGSWFDLLEVSGGLGYLIPSMLKYVEQGRVGPHPDVYGRLAWDRPAVTIKRECSHTGNGRYAHPEQNRLCTVRELGILQGFPNDYRFEASSLSNMYRHVGDAVPPLVSFQIAAVAKWILTGRKPSLKEIILPKTHLSVADIS